MGGTIQFHRGERTCRPRLFRLQTTPTVSTRRFFLLIGLFVVPASRLRGQSPYESSADFAKYAMKLREQALLKVEPQVFVPTTSRAAATARFPWKTNIITTVFWIGESAGGNNPVPNYKSCWDANWQASYG